MHFTFWDVNGQLKLTSCQLTLRSDDLCLSKRIICHGNNWLLQLGIYVCIYNLHLREEEEQQMAWKFSVHFSLSFWIKFGKINWMTRQSIILTHTELMINKKFWFVSFSSSSLFYVYILLILLYILYKNIIVCSLKLTTLVKKWEHNIYLWSTNENNKI